VSRASLLYAIPPTRSVTVQVDVPFLQLCEATFTRPQHVGRHLRAHTGDRPYECKECPLRFARR